MRDHILLAAALILGLTTWAAYGDEGHGHDSNTPDPQQAGSDTMHGEHGHSEEGVHHQHAEWKDPPEAYANRVSDKWADADAIARGEEIYQKQCVSCHGADGRGTGPIAQSLAHPPADLTNNFHTAPGNGDAYLFWRVSEGGTVEPFKSQGSEMPAFKNVLSASERWDVLAYVHSFFHQGLMEWKQSGSAAGKHSETGEAGS